jgi:serine/threonine-protein kinase
VPVAIKQIQIKPEVAGRSIYCPHCRHINQVPAATVDFVNPPEETVKQPPAAPAVSELLLRWLELRSQGQIVAAEELCFSHPELVDEVVREMRALEQMQQLVGSPPSAEETETGRARARPPEQMPDAPTVPGYEILAELGRGGMGVVYKARHGKLQRTVALKMILGGGHAGAADLERFKTEAEAIARLHHPHIVQIYEVGEHDGLPYFSLEFCAGGSLEKKLAGTPLPANKAAALVEQLAHAMQAAHAKGVIHRDLKPANVLLAEDGAPKITDFGLAKKLDEAGQTQTGAVMGTPSYMAPEQARGMTKELGPPCDIYAPGAILYECLTGRPPFRAATMLETLDHLRHKEPVPPTKLRTKVPADLKTICLKCLEKVPARRYESAGSLAADLSRFLAGELITARPPTARERLMRWLRRHKEVVYLAGGTLAAVVLFAILLWLRPFAERNPESTSDSNTSQEEQWSDTLLPDLDNPNGPPVFTAWRRSRALIQMQSLALAMHDYHKANNQLPPPAICSRADGRPLLSWRVAILPFVGEAELYRQFQLDQPWDSEHNLKLLESMPKLFFTEENSPPEAVEDYFRTYFQAFVGPGAAFEMRPNPKHSLGAGGLTWHEFSDGVSNTILLAEAAEPVPWTKPADLNFAADKPLPRLGGVFERGFHVAIADGQVEFVPRSAHEKALRAVITRAGKEIVADALWRDPVPLVGWPVEGKVTYRDKPLANVAVVLRTPQPAPRTLAALTLKDGSFIFPHVPNGKYRVCTVDRWGNPIIDLPGRYGNVNSTPFRLDAKGGQPPVEFALQEW